MNIRYGTALIGAILAVGPGNARAEKAAEEAAPSLEGRIAFSSNRDGAWRIWTVKPDGSGLEKLLDHPNQDEHDVSPLFSPDGKWIYFTSTRGGTSGVWTMRADGTDPERICDGVQGQLSPDGTRLTFHRDNKVWVRHVADGKEKQIVPDSFEICSTPDWDPTGKKIVFACRWDGPNSLWIVDADGGDPVKLFDRKPASGPSWSPDGTAIAYETETRLYTIRPNGTGNRMITFFGGIQRFPRWSPDGKHLVYNQGPNENGPWEVYVIPSTGGKPVRLTQGGSDVNPDWR